MTAIGQRLPRQILLPLRRIERRERQLNLAIALLRSSIVAMLLVLLAAMLLGTLDRIPRALNTAIAVGVWFASLVTVVLLTGPSFRRASLITVARQIEQRHPSIQERISSALELSETGQRFSGSSTLIAQLTREAESEAAALSSKRLVDARKLVPWMSWLGTTLAIWMILALFPGTRHILSRGIPRLFAPWRQVSPLALDLPATPTALLTPQLTNLAIHYDYPTYTVLASRTVDGLDGTVDALVGTRATVTLHTSRPLNPDRSSLTVDRTPPLPLTQIKDSPHTYTATFTVHDNSYYTLALVDSQSAGVRHEPPRAIIARPDQLPSIVMQSPTPDVSVRPDDVVPVQFLAADDFGITRIEMVLRVDDRGPQTMPVPFDRSDPKHVTGPTLNLKIDDILKTTIPEHLGQITYRLRVFDNRDPDPQLGVSVEQVLRVDPDQPRSFLGGQEQREASRLEDLIQNTLQELDRSSPRISRAKTRDGSEPLGEWQRKELHQAATDLTAISKGLSRAAEQTTNPIFGRVSASLREVADGSLRDAAEQAARADIESDDWQQRNDAIGKSVAAIASARQSLEKLLDDGSIERIRGMSEAARNLASAANLQKTSRRKRAEQRLQQAFAEVPSLRQSTLPDPLLEQAAQAAREAEHFQQLADLKPAAGALQRAASALSQALTIASTPVAPQGDSLHAHPLADGPAQGGQGASIRSMKLPAAIRDLGLSADQWARLPPLAQHDLLAAAQQSAPPEYREMVRDYFVKVSQMHGDQP
jgi:hypothetical protein